MSISPLPPTEALRPQRGGERPPSAMDPASFSSVFEAARQIGPSTAREQPRLAEPPRVDPGRQREMPRSPPATPAAPQRSAPAAEQPRAPAPAARASAPAADTDDRQEPPSTATESAVKTAGATAENLPSRLRPQVQSARRPDPNAPPPEGPTSPLPPWLGEPPIDTAPIGEQPALPDLPGSEFDLGPQAQAPLPDAVPSSPVNHPPLAVVPPLPDVPPAQASDDADAAANAVAGNAFLQASPQPLPSDKTSGNSKLVLSPSIAQPAPAVPESEGRSTMPTPLPAGGRSAGGASDAVPEQKQPVADPGRQLTATALPQSEVAAQIAAQLQTAARSRADGDAASSKEIAGRAARSSTASQAAAEPAVAAGSDTTALDRQGEARPELANGSGAAELTAAATDDSAAPRSAAPTPKPEAPLAWPTPAPSAGLTRSAPERAEVLSVRDALPGAPQVLAGLGATPSASGAATATSATLNSTLGQPAFADELGAQVALWTRQGVQQAELRLNPAELGPVQVRIQLDGQQAQVLFAAEQQTTRDALQSALGQLAKALEQDGLRLAGSDVQAQFQQGAQQERRSSDGQATADSRGGGAGGSRLRGLEASSLAPPLQRQAQRGLLDLYA